MQNVKPGVSVHDLCELGDRLIEEQVKLVCKKVKVNEKGIAYPTCIALNSCAGHLSPLPEDPPINVKGGDVIKIDLGVHIQGFIATVAHTFIVPAEGEVLPHTGRKADVICAAHYAAECALHLLRPGHTNTEITQAIKKCADIFHVNPVEGVLSHEMKQHCIDANNVILNREEIDQHAEEFKFEANQAYQIDILMSTGDGKTREGPNTRTTVFKRAVDRTYQLKVQASRDILREINSKYPCLLFSLRSLDAKKRRLGINEIVKHELVDAYPVLFEKDGETIAQFKFTALILPNQTLKLGGPFPLPHVSSQYSIEKEESIIKILSLPIAVDKKKKDVAMDVSK